MTVARKSRRNRSAAQRDTARQCNAPMPKAVHMMMGIPIRSGSRKNLASSATMQTAEKARTGGTQTTAKAASGANP